MTDGYDCYQNALAERINGILKAEFLLHRPRDVRQARQMVTEAVEIYNVQCPTCPLKCGRPMQCIGRPWLLDGGRIIHPIGVNLWQDGSASHSPKKDPGNVGVQFISWRGRHVTMIRSRRTH